MRNLVFFQNLIPNLLYNGLSSQVDYVKATVKAIPKYIYDGIFEAREEIGQDLNGRLDDNTQDQEQKDEEAHDFIWQTADLANGVIGGAVLGGIQGALMASSLVDIDQNLMQNFGIKKHFLSSSAMWTSLALPLSHYLAEKCPEYATQIYATTLGLSAILAFASKDPLNNKENAKKVHDGLPPVLRLFDKEHVLDKFERAFNSELSEGESLTLTDGYNLLKNKVIFNAAATFGISLLGSLIDQCFTMHAAGKGSDIMQLLLKMQDSKTSFQESTVSIFSILATVAIKEAISYTLGQYCSSFDQDLNNSITSSAINDVFLNPSNANKILALPDRDLLSKKFTSDLQMSFMLGNSALRSMTCGRIDGFRSLSNVVDKGSESLVIYQLISIFKDLLKESNKASAIQQEIADFQLQEHETVSELSENLSIILATGTQGFVKSSYSYVRKEIETRTFKTKLEEQKQKIFSSIIDLFDKYIDVMYLAFKTVTGQVKIEEVFLFKAWINSATKLLNCESGMTVNMPKSFLDQIQARLKKLFDGIKKETSTELVRTTNEEGKLVISNYKLVKVESDTVMLNIKHLEFMPSKVYAILGDSGLGKTTLFKDIMNGLEPGVRSSGTISFPSVNGTQTKPMLIDQKMFMHKRATLIEAITGKHSNEIPASEKEVLKRKIVELFKALGIDQEAKEGREDAGLIKALDDPKYDLKTLSGGQLKKIGIIKAILAQPKVLIMDEVFEGIDLPSLPTIEKILTKELPNTTIIAIDHKAASHNFDGFYDHCITLKNVGYEETPLVSIPIPKSSTSPSEGIAPLDEGSVGESKGDDVTLAETPESRDVPTFIGTPDLRLGSINIEEGKKLTIIGSINTNTLTISEGVDL